MSLPVDKSTSKIQETEENSKEDIEYYKKRCVVLEKDLFKLQTQNKKLDDGLRKLQELNTLYAKNMNNTSISFFLPSEFKSTWENLLKDKLIDGFENIYNDYYWFSHIVQDTLKSIYDESDILIRNKIREMLKFFNIKDDNIEKYLDRFKNFFQEHFFSIFVFTDDFLNRIKEKLLIITKTYKDFNFSEDLNNDIQGKSFKLMVQTAFKLTMYMLLHDPILSLSIEPFETREIKYFFYEKGEYINIDGFEKNQTPCIAILDPPQLRNKYTYQGIKTAVCIIPNPNNQILEECEKNKTSEPKKSKNYDSNTINITLEKEFNSEKNPEKININFKKANETEKKSSEKDLQTEALNFNTCPNEENLAKESLLREKFSVSLEFNDKILKNENLDLNKQITSSTLNQKEKLYQKCLDQPLSMEKKHMSEYSSILLKNLKNNIDKTLRETSSKSNQYFDNNKSKSKEHLTTENITNTNLSTNNNILDNISGSRKKSLHSSILRLCEANKINYPLNITKANPTNNNIFTMKEYKNNVNHFIKLAEKEKKSDLEEANNYFTENSTGQYYFKSKQFNNTDTLRSNLKKNVQEAFDYVTNSNHINPLKFDFNTSGKKSQLNDMKYNAPKKDNYVTINNEKTESNFKIKFERLYSNVTPENCKVLITDNIISAKKDLSSMLERKGTFLNGKSSSNGSMINTFKK